MHKTILAMLTMGLSGACGLSESDAKEAFATIQSVGDQGKAQSGAQTTGSITTVAWTYNCADAGNTVFAGTVGAGGVASTGAMSFDLDMTFAGCEQGGHSVDGKVSYFMDAVSSATSGTVNLIIRSDGPLEIDGDTCDSIDMTFNASSVGGAGPGASVSIGWSGSVCGYEQASYTTSVVTGY